MDSQIFRSDKASELGANFDFGAWHDIASSRGQRQLWSASPARAMNITFNEKFYIFYQPGKWPEVILMLSTFRTSVCLIAAAEITRFCKYFLQFQFAA